MERLILLVVWMLLMPIVSVYTENQHSKRRVKIEKKEPYSSEEHGQHQFLDMVILIVVGLIILFFPI